MLIPRVAENHSGFSRQPCFFRFKTVVRDTVRRDESLLTKKKFEWDCMHRRTNQWENCSDTKETPKKCSFHEKRSSKEKCHRDRTSAGRGGIALNVRLNFIEHKKCRIAAQTKIFLSFSAVLSRLSPQVPLAVAQCTEPGFEKECRMYRADVFDLILRKRWLLAVKFFDVNKPGINCK